MKEQKTSAAFVLKYVRLVQKNVVNMKMNIARNVQKCAASAPKNAGEWLREGSAANYCVE